MKRFRAYIIILLLLNVSYAKWWGSIYIDFKTGIAGGSYNYNTEKIANDEAKSSCTDKHKSKGSKYNCEYIISFYNTCGAVYWSPTNKKAGYGYSVFQNDAENAARRACKENGGKNCQLSLSFCTDRVIY